LEKGLQRIEETLVWRREYGTDTLTGAEVEEESRTGKQYVVGFDKQSRPCLYMHPYRQNTKVSPRQIQFVVWTLERAVDMMPPGVENLALCIDFGASQGGGQPTSMGQARQVLYILQTYYAERLGRAICVDVPGIFWAFYKLIQSFIDPVTKDKLRFIRDDAEARDLVDPSQLIEEQFHGDLNFIYDHEQYFDALERLCAERRAAQFERFERLCGSKIGSSEFIIKGGQDSTSKTINPSTSTSSTSGALAIDAHAPATPNLSSSPDEREGDVLTPRASMFSHYSMNGKGYQGDAITPSVSSSTNRVPFASPALSTYELAPLASVSQLEEAKLDPEELLSSVPSQQDYVQTASQGLQAAVAESTLQSEDFERTSVEHPVLYESKQDQTVFSSPDPQAQPQSAIDAISPEGLAESIAMPMQNLGGLGKAIN